MNPNDQKRVSACCGAEIKYSNQTGNELPYCGKCWKPCELVREGKKEKIEPPYKTNKQRAEYLASISPKHSEMYRAISEFFGVHNLPYDVLVPQNPAPAEPPQATSGMTATAGCGLNHCNHPDCHTIGEPPRPEFTTPEIEEAIDEILAAPHKEEEKKCKACGKELPCVYITDHLELFCGYGCANVSYPANTKLIWTDENHGAWDDYLAKIAMQLAEASMKYGVSYQERQKAMDKVLQEASVDITKLISRREVAAIKLWSAEKRKEIEACWTDFDGQCDGEAYRLYRKILALLGEGGEK